MRAFVPLTRPGLQAALGARMLPATTAFAVTPGLREWYAEGDEEELEDVARGLAATESLRLLAADPAAERQRVVVAVEAEGAVLDGARGAVTLMADVPLTHWAAALIDGPEAAGVVARAASVVGAADAGDPDAEIALGDAEDVELLWYGIQELMHEF